MSGETETPDLVRKVSHRLFKAIVGVVVLCLLVLYLVPALTGEGPVILLVLLTGTIGGFVSIQRRVNAMPVDGLRLMAASWLSAFLAPFVGGVLALVLYLLFLTELVGGQLFPHFALPESGGIQVLSQVQGAPVEYAKLLFWSFIAGYSESFVVDVLGKFAKSTPGPT
jgi:hypothetical protein